MKRNKKIISVLLAVIMLLSALPLTGISAFAQGDEEQYSFTELLSGTSYFILLSPGAMEYNYEYKFNADGTVTETYFDFEIEPETNTMPYEYHDDPNSEYGYVTFGDWKLYDNPYSYQAFLIVANEGSSDEYSALLLSGDYIDMSAENPFRNTSWNSNGIIDNFKKTVRFDFSKDNVTNILSSDIKTGCHSWAMSSEVTRINPDQDCGIYDIYVEMISPRYSLAFVFFDDHSALVEKWTRRFNDVSEKGWYYEAVMTNVEYGIMSGYGNSYNFGTSDNLKRQDFVCMMANLLDADVSSYANQTPAFKDVQKGSYYAASVNWAVKNNIISGYQNGKFGVGDPITREQVCVILYRMEGMPAVSNVNGTLAKFSDQARISSFARDAVAWAVQQGIINGMSNGTISSTTTASRAQIAAIMYNLLVSDS